MFSRFAIGDVDCHPISSLSYSYPFQIPQMKRSKLDSIIQLNETKEIRDLHFNLND